MQDVLLFPFAEYWWAYAAFVVFVVAVLSFDLGVFSSKAHEVTLKEATVRSVIFISLALLFCVGLYY
jgi:tellurite resistance protein TerC